MKPFALVTKRYKLPTEAVPGVPFIPHPLQVGVINTLAPLEAQGHWNDMGTGKTFMVTLCLLYRRLINGGTAVIIMPPLLLRQWRIWLEKITDTETGKPLRVCAYQGTPAKRAKMSWDVDFILVGAQIFRKEYQKFLNLSTSTQVNAAIDEATIVAWIGSDIHSKAYTLTRGIPVIMLTGTPAGKPLKAYGLTLFTNPDAYASLADFKAQHVESFDQFDQPREYKNLDKLREALMKNSVRVLFSDMYRASQEPLYDPHYYELAAAHDRLYGRVAEEKIMELPDGSKIDATQAGRVQHLVSQLVVNWDYFSQDPKSVSNTIEAIEDELEALGDKKLVVFAHYKLSVSTLVRCLSKYGAVQVNSEVTGSQRDKHVQRFVSDPTCRVIVIQYRSGGFGLDGLQYASHNIVCAEPCTDPDTFHQSVARLKRTGQKYRVHVKMLIAEGTTQVRSFRNLLKADDISNQVIRNEVQLRDAIYGRGPRL